MEEETAGDVSAGLLRTSLMNEDLLTMGLDNKDILDGHGSSSKDDRL